MQTFFSCLNAIDQFIDYLRCHHSLVKCQHCSKVGQLVSHGFVYKQFSSQQSAAVGKRVICSRRYGRNGCGKTVKLSLAHAIPAIRYSATVLIAFLAALLAGESVDSAYRRATGQQETRHAWRWLNKLNRQQVNYRGLLAKLSNNTDDGFVNRSRRLQVLLPVISRLFATTSDTPCRHFQLVRQMSFF